MAYSRIPPILTWHQRARGNVRIHRKCFLPSLPPVVPSHDLLLSSRTPAVRFRVRSPRLFVHNLLPFVRTCAKHPFFRLPFAPPNLCLRVINDHVNPLNWWSNRDVPFFQ